MKNIKIKFVVFFSAIVLFGIVTTAYATLNIETEVNVPASCTVTDTDGVAHNYPQVDSPNSYLAICALDAAIKNGSISNTQLSNQFPSLGLFITTINDVAANPSGQYWAIYQNGNFANFGITSLPVVAGDTIVFQLHDFSDNNLGDQATLHILSLGTPAAPTGGGPLLTPADIPPIATLAPIIKPTFDTKKAFGFLIAQQKNDGSFGEDLYTGWVALALASGNYQDQTIKLVKYFGESETTGTLLTDYERHAMALMALGLNPYNTNGENYIEKITAGFDGKQFGNASEDNDDIFALIVLQNAGYTPNEKMISDDINFILSQQKENGSWDESVDMTGASMEALSAFSPIPGIGESLEKAKEFLKQNQKDNGSWGNNASSTAWALEGIFALNEKPEDWIKSENTPFDYLASIQDTDGGIKNENTQNKIWETAYVASALSGKTWNQIMQKFEKPKMPAVIETAPIKNTHITKASVIKKVKPKLENLVSQNTAAVINAVTPTPATIKTENSQKGWFARLLENIFSVF
ncbi:MAG: DUF4430 domain-containing protein [Patescibacteria group bacterium]